MADQPLAEMVEIAVREFTSEADAAIQQSSQIAEHDDSNPTGKRRRVEVELQESEEGEDSIQTLLYSASKTLCLRLDAIEANLNSMEDKCKCLRAKVDMLANQNAFRPPLAEHTATEGQRQTGSSHW
uniref:protein BANP-like n=2 Tax=Pristiophorus japonicus TaxID=55135 RepID=UPI00398EAA2E